MKHLTLILCVALLGYHVLAQASTTESTTQESTAAGTTGTTGGTVSEPATMAGSTASGAPTTGASIASGGPTTTTSVPNNISTTQAITLVNATIMANITTPNPNITTTTTTTTPTTTTTTTLSPEQIFHNLCMSYEQWLPETATTCISPFLLCFYNVITTTNNYLKCKTYMNETEPSQKIADISPMLLTSYLLKLGTNIIQTFIAIKAYNPRLAKLETARRAEQYQSNFMWMVGLQQRFSDKEWPDYELRTFRPSKKWNKRNDTIRAPYGSLPRGEYQYHFFIYDNLLDKQITDREQVRLKHEWPTHHPIYRGDYIDYMADRDLWYKEGLVVNSALVMLTVNPEQPNPLPGDLVITFTHLQKGLINPICVYWQYLKPDIPGTLPGAGYWSNYGVKLTGSNETMYVCGATHYGAFALLMEHEIIVVEPYDYWALLTILGTVVAILMSTAYLVAMFMFQLQRTLYNRIFMFTDLSVLMFNIFFLYAQTNKDDWDTCTTISAFLEFWQVQTLSWMMIVNIHMLSRLRKVFNDKTNIEAFYYILAWGIPIAVAVALQEYPHSHYDKLRFCWAKLEGIHMMYFGGPLLVLLLMQFAIILILMAEVKKYPDKVDSDINYIRALAGIRSSTTILVTVALIWVVATLGMKQSGLMETICMLAIPALNIILCGEIIYYYFYGNDEVVDAIAENKRIKENIRFKKFKHLDGIKMKVSYVAKEGDMEIDNEETAPDQDDNDDDEFDFNMDDDVTLDDLVDFDDDVDVR